MLLRLLRVLPMSLEDACLIKTGTTVLCLTRRWRLLRFVDVLMPRVRRQMKHVNHTIAQASTTRRTTEPTRNAVRAPGDMLANTEAMVVVDDVC